MTTKRADLEDLEQAQEEEQAEADAIAETEVTPMTTRPHQLPENSEEEDRFDKGEGSSPDNVEPEESDDEGEDDTEGMPFDDEDDSEGTPDEDSEEDDGEDDMPDFLKEESLVPVVCHACTRKFAVNQVKLGLRCICGSDDLDLDEEDEGTDSGDSSDYTGASPTTSALDDWQTNIANETSVEKLQNALRENDNLRYHRDGFPVEHQKTLDSQDEAIRARLKELGASKTSAKEDVVPWESLRQVSVTDLQKGDRFLRAGAGVMHRVYPDGRVEGHGMGPGVGGAQGEIWKVVDIRGDHFVARRESDGEHLTQDVSPGSTLNTLKIIAKTALEVDKPNAEIPAPGGAVGDIPIPPTEQPPSSDSPHAEELPDNQQFAEPFTEDDGEAVEEKVESIAIDIFKTQGVSRRQALLIAQKVVSEFPVIATKTAATPTTPGQFQTGRPGKSFAQYRYTENGKTRIFDLRQRVDGTIDIAWGFDENGEGGGRSNLPAHITDQDEAIAEVESNKLLGRHSDWERLI